MSNWNLHILRYENCDGNEFLEQRVIINFIKLVNKKYWKNTFHWIEINIFKKQLNPFSTPHNNRTLDIGRNNHKSSKSGLKIVVKKHLHRIKDRTSHLCHQILLFDYIVELSMICHFVSRQKINHLREIIAINELVD